jgi:hypothetical protein
MTPQQKIKTLILLRLREKAPSGPEITAANVDELYAGITSDSFYDARNEVREGDVETGLTSKEWSRHYEQKEVAAQLPDGSWVGWTYWYGGGKHGCPEEIDWIPGAYDLTCTEEKKLVTVRTFAKVDQPASAVRK